MDFQIICFTVLQFVFFLFFHILTIRKYGDYGVLTWLMRIFIAVGLIGAFAEFAFIESQFLATKIFAILVTFASYGCLTFTYIMAIFGISLTSLRIQILSEIFQSKGQRLKLSDLKHKYTRDRLIKTRLFRLESSGVITKKNGKYYLKNKFSPYFVHIRIADFLYRLYK